VSWSGHKCHINLPEHVTKQAPEFDPTQPIDRDFEKYATGDAVILKSIFGKFDPSPQIASFIKSISMK
jgi:hypothetical protein